LRKAIVRVTRSSVSGVSESRVIGDSV